MSKPAKRAQKNYEKYLGKTMSKYIKKKLPDFEPPLYLKSNDYVRTGTTIVLYAYRAYYQAFPQDATKTWENHTQKTYLYLAKRIPEY
ncbi:MAG TPA: hypothetical protein VIJ75_17140 [Hanamia sp.]